MFAVLFGSYSIPITVAGIPSFISLEIDDSVFSSGSAAAVSYSDLTLVVTTSSSSLEIPARDFSGVFFVISEKSEPVICLLEGVYGLYVLIPMIFLLSIHDVSFSSQLSCAYYCPASQQINGPGRWVLNLTVPRKSRYPCCPLSELNDCLLGLSGLADKSFHVSCSFRRGSWCLRS